MVCIELEEKLRIQGEEGLKSRGRLLYETEYGVGGE